RHLKHKHFFQVSCNGFSLSSLLCFYAWKRPRCVNQSYNWFVKFLCQLHQTQSLPVPFWIGHAEVPGLSLFRVPAFLLANEHDTLFLDHARYTYHRFVVGHVSVAMKFDKFTAYLIYIIERIWCLRMPR